MSRLKFISDSDLEEAVGNLLMSARRDANKEAKFDKHVIDPFSAIFEMAGFQVNEEAWRTNERARQAQKAISNHVGAFHQNILGKVKGWENPGAGGIIDLVSNDQKIIAEIKNKHNTLNAGGLTKLYTGLENLVMPKKSIYKDYIAYYVIIIPKTPKRFDVPFVPSDSAKGKKESENSLIRKIDGYSFYGKVTGVDNALYQLFKALPEVIQSHLRADGFRLQDTKFLDDFFEAAYGNSK